MMMDSKEHMMRNPQIGWENDINNYLDQDDKCFKTNTNAKNLSKIKI